MVLGQAVACSRAPSNMNNLKADKIPVGELWTAAQRPQLRRSTRDINGTSRCDGIPRPARPQPPDL